MKYFRQVHAHWIAASVEDLKMELAANERAWLHDEKRQNTVRVQRHTQSIFLRGVKKLPGELRNSSDIHESADSRLAALFPKSMECIRRIAAERGGELCRALYARLEPNAVVYPHVDGGSYYACRDRYHLVIDSPSGSILRCGGEEVRMQNGELWWFDNKVLHDSENASDVWRTHLIFDLLPLAS